MQKEEGFATCFFRTAMLLLTSTGLGSDEPDTSCQDLLSCPVCTAAVNNYDFRQLVKHFIAASCLRQKTIKAGPDMLLFIQCRYNN